MADVKRILCIEDNMSNAELFRRMLSKDGYDIYVAATGGRGIEYARENHIDLILCDINLPGMTGFEVLEQLRAIPRFATLPIIAVTANSINAGKQACLDAGFDAYINKPILRNELNDLIDQYLGEVGHG
jgi:CheY-like chemotaxis protein